MKKIMILVAGLVWFHVFAGAQTIADVAKAETITWYGIDYSETKFLNFGAYLSNASVHKGLNRWSYHPFGHDDVDTWTKKYKKDKLVVDDKTAAKRNDTADYDAHMGTADYEMSMETIKMIVSEYDIKGTGYGVMFIADNFNNNGTKKAYTWFVFINQADGSVIDAKRIVTETYGDWAISVTNTLKESAKFLRKAD